MQQSHSRSAEVSSDENTIDPVEEAIAANLGHGELLHRVASALARMAAFLEWIRENPEHYSLSQQLDISRAIGRRQRALMALVATSRSEKRDAPAGDPPPAVVEQAVHMLTDEVLRVLRQVATPAQVAEFEARLADDGWNGGRRAAAVEGATLPPRCPASSTG